MVLIAKIMTKITLPNVTGGYFESLKTQKPPIHIDRYSEKEQIHFEQIKNLFFRIGCFIQKVHGAPS